MNVYQIIPTESYCGGIALVAANNKQEAINIFLYEEFRTYEYDNCNCMCTIMKDLDYSGDEPTVIVDAIYME